jgi:glycosyltransferase involved in cell wall biosynthesis
MPFISICIPAYKQPDDLRRLLKSIEIQTFKDFEVILSDDSQDGSVLGVVKEHDWKFELYYFHNQPSKGSPENWNSSVSHAKGKWIKIMHHDDWFENPNSLERFVKAIEEHPNESFIFCKSFIFNTLSGEKLLYNTNDSKIKKINQQPSALFHANIIGAPSATIIKKDAFIPFDSNLIWLVDIECYMRLIYKYGSYALEEPLIITSDQHPLQLTNTLRDNKNVELKEFFYCYDKLKSLLNPEDKIIFNERLLFLMQTYKIQSNNEIRHAGFTGKIPLFISLYCFISKFNNKIAIKFLGKWIQLQQTNHGNN